MDLSARYGRSRANSGRSPPTQRASRSPSRGSPDSRRSPQRAAAAASSRLYSQHTAASSARRRSRSRSRSRSPTPSAQTRTTAARPLTAADALAGAIADRDVRLDGRKFRDVRTFFELLDTEGTGAISPDALRYALQRLELGLSRAELRSCYDISRGNTIELPEFERWVLNDDAPALSSPHRRLRNPGASKALARRLAQSVASDLASVIRRKHFKLASSLGRFDSSGNGTLSVAEFREGLHSLAGTVLTKQQVRPLMSELHKAGEGRVDYEEFLAAVTRSADARRLAGIVTERLRQSIRMHRESLMKTFHDFDTNSDGVLSAKEVRRGLEARGITLQSSEVDQLMQVMDTDGNNTVDYDEFVAAVVQLGIDSSDEGDIADSRSMRHSPPRLSVRTSKVYEQTTDSDDTDSTLPEAQREWGHSRRRSVSSDADDMTRFARHGLTANADFDHKDQLIADLQRQLRLLRNQRDGSRQDDYMRAELSVGLNGKARARQLRNRVKAGRLQGRRQVSSLFWAFSKWKQYTTQKKHEGAARLFSGQWHIVGRDHDDHDVEEWVVLWIGRAGDVHGEFFTRAPAGSTSAQLSQLEGGILVGHRLRFTQVYPHSGLRTQWELTSRGGRGQLSGIWEGDAAGEFTAERCQVWVDSCDAQPQTTPRGTYDDRKRRSRSPSPGVGRGRSSLLTKAARRLARVLTQDMSTIIYENRMSLASTFRRTDKSRSGTLSVAEFREGLHSLAGTVLTKQQVRPLMSELHKAGEGRVDYEEFLAAVTRSADARRLAGIVTERLRQSIRMHRESLMKTFHDFDTNSDGVLSAKEVRRGLEARGITLQSSEVDQLMQVMDTDGNNTVDYDEFVAAVVQLGIDSSDEGDIADSRSMRHSPPRLSVRTPSDDGDSPRSPRQRLAGRAGTPALISAISQRLDEINGWQTTNLFRPLSQHDTTTSEVHAMLDQLDGGQAITSFETSRKVVAQTRDACTLTALLYAWLLELDSPIPRAMFQDCKLVSERAQHARQALTQMVNDISNPGQSILRAVIDLYRRHDPDAQDTDAIDNGLAPALMHSPQGADRKWNFGDFIALLVRELPSPRDRSGSSSPGKARKGGASKPFVYRTEHPLETHSEFSGTSPRRNRPHSPSTGIFSNCQGRPNSGGGNERSLRKSGVSRPKMKPTPF